jgi:hypothetical protein
MNDLDIQIDTQDVKNRLDELADGLRNRAVRAGLVKAAAPIKRSMKSLAPKLSGDLSKSIGHKTLSRRDAARIDLFAGGSNRVSVENPGVSIIVGPNRKNARGYSQAYKATLMEHGVKRGFRRYKKPRKGSQSLGYMYEGFSGTYFMARSLEQNQSGMNDRFYAGVSAYLNRIDA